MSWIEGLRGVLFDIDGTLLHGDRAIPGVARVFARLDARGIVYRLITNTTRRPRAAIADVLNDAGFRFDPGQILTPAVLARRRILESGRTRAALLVPEAARADFEGLQIVEQRPDWVVIGDLGAGFTHARLNRAFGWLQEGAAFLALHKNPYWHAGDAGRVLDAGAYVAALEFASGVVAEVVGKPNRAFFELALGTLRVPAGQVLVVGDSVENEGRGAAAAGCRTAVVRTGKFSDGDLVAVDYVPDLLLDSAADLLA